MKRQPLISIIIPVYNAEKYMEACLSSILEQEFSDYEVIAVNDGSTDGSLQICESFSRKDERVKVCSTENQGVSHARNLGIRMASSPWLLFLDSDDYLAGQCLALFAGLLREDSECIYGDYVRGADFKGTFEAAEAEAADVLSMTLDPVNHDLLPAFYVPKSSTFNSACGKLYAKRIIEEYEIYFDEKLRLSEDLFFNVQYLQRIRKVTLTDLPVFVYRENEASVSSHFKEAHVQNRIYLFQRLKTIVPDPDVLILSTFLDLICRMEKYTSGSGRKRLEKMTADYFEENRNSISVKGKDLSVGKWKNQVFRCCGYLFLKGRYSLGFGILNLYVKVAKGKI